MPISSSSSLSRPGFLTSPGMIAAVCLAVGVAGVLGALAVLTLMPEKGLWLILGTLAIAPFGLYMLIMSGPEALAAFRRLQPKIKWYHWLWFIIFVGSSVWRIREVSEASNNPLDSAALLRVAPTFWVAGWLILRQLRGQTKWLQQLFHGVALPMGIYCAACLVSTLWSINQPWTAYKSFEITFDFAVMAAALATLHEPEEFASIWDWVWLIYGIEVVWTWLSIPIWPADTLGDGLRLAGAIPNVSSNGLGASGAILGIIALCRLLPLDGKAKDKSFYWFLLLFGLATMGFAQTRNALAGFVVAGVLLCYFTKRMKWIIFGSIPAGLLFVVAGGPALLMTYLLRGQSTAELESASSRTIWWSFGWEQFLRRPWTGWGAYVGGKFVVLDKLNLNVPTLHSDYVETLVDVGLWGLIPLIIAVLLTWFYLVKGVRSTLLTGPERQLAMEAACIMIIATIRSIFDIELIWHSPLMFMLLLGYAEMIRRTLIARRDAKESERGVARLQESW